MIFEEELIIPASVSPSASKKNPELAIHSSKMVPYNHSLTNQSKSCPFPSPSCIETTPKQRTRRKSVTLSISASSMPEDSVFTEIEDHGSRGYNKSIVNSITSVKTSLRVRVINQLSDLFKDLLVEIRHDLNLFDAIYDKNVVKKANIRKWGSVVTKQVKSGSHEIRCSVWDDEVNSPCHTYSIDDLKQTSTRQLYHLVGPESDLIKLKLQCVEKKVVNAQSTSISTSSPSNNTFYPSVDDSKAPYSRSVESSSESRNVLQTRRTDLPVHHPNIASNDRGSFRCPFSGVAVDESVFKKIRDRDTSSNSRGQSSFSNHCDDTVSELDENDNSTIRTVRTANETYSMLSAKSIAESPIIEKSTMRVRITNESSKRYKDLVVAIKPDEFVHESIYDHKSVKSAQVRKWSSEVVKDVKRKVKEIQFVVLDGSVEGKVFGTFRVDDLKRLSTKDLFGLTQSDPVQLVLRCVDTDTKSNVIDSNPFHNIHSDDTVTTIPSRITALKQNSQRSLQGNSKRSSRPNHMNLSVNTLNGSFSSLASSNGSKAFSHGGANASFTLDDKTLATPSCLRLRNNFHNNKYFSEPITNVDHVSIQENNNHNILLDDTNTEFKSTILVPNLSNQYDREKLSEFKRLCRSKKGREFQSGDNLNKMSAISRGRRNSICAESHRRNASFTSTTSDLRNISLRSVPCDLRNLSMETPETDGRDSSLRNISHRSYVSSDSLTSLGNISSKSQTKTKTYTESDKINRFLEFGARKSIPAKALKDENAPLIGTSTTNSQKSGESLRTNIPPISEIEVVNSKSSVAPVRLAQPSIPLSGELVKQVFPYHIVINDDFRIIQVGSSLCSLIENEFLIDSCISDIFTITGPIPSFGKKWDWQIMDKMKEKTIFLEGLRSTSNHQKPKIKGSIIELSKAPERKVLLALSPNVKNLSELEEMNLSMTDLPLHSCQRDAVLLGEHSKSEVKLTNHLDQLHRDLIDSMEKQIEDRTDELATANANLESANAQLAVQSAKQLEHFACMSHEIRTPLNCIVGMSSLLLEDSPSMDPMHADSIRMINTSGELLKAVVDDVLDYAKLESGSFEVDIKSTKLQDTLDSVLYSISQKVQDKNIRLRTHFTPTVPEYIETDSRRLQQVLFNLLGNAGKFSKANGVIDLSVSLIKASTQLETDKESENRDLIRFSIRDYGKGIEKKDFQTIFQPFSQASKETQNVYGGTGLGLSITSKLVHRLGGTISLDSELGKFADFTVDLPMNGEYIEVERISNLLRNTTIVFVEPEQIHTDSTLPSPVKPEPVPLDQAVVDVFDLNVIRCHSVDKLNDKMFGEKKNNNHFSVLVHEALHNSSSTEKLDSILGQSNYSLMTYGANFLVEKTRASHFKSLTGLFPATLLESIAKQKGSITNVKNISTKVTSLSPDTAKKIIGASTKASKKPSSNSKEKMKQNDFRKSMKVLYAEDNLVNQKVLARVLNRSGIKDITIVDNGKKAVDISATIKYDCILLDMQMPVMDGMEACKIIMERDPDTIIVFVTAHALDEFKIKAKAAGAKGFISKPFRVGDIDHVLKEIYEN